VIRHADCPAAESAMTTLFILNDAPYGSERSYNALRLAKALAKMGQPVRVFLLGDAVTCAAAGQKVPAGYYNAADMVRTVGGEVGLPTNTRGRSPGTWNRSLLSPACPSSPVVRPLRS